MTLTYSMVLNRLAVANEREKQIRRFYKPLPPQQQVAPRPWPRRHRFADVMEPGDVIRTMSKNGEEWDLDGDKGGVDSTDPWGESGELGQNTDGLGVSSRFPLPSRDTHPILGNVSKVEMKLKKSIEMDVEERRRSLKAQIQRDMKPPVDEYELEALEPVFKPPRPTPIAAKRKLDPKNFYTEAASTRELAVYDVSARLSREGRESAANKGGIDPTPQSVATSASDGARGGAAVGAEAGRRMPEAGGGSGASGAAGSGRDSRLGPALRREVSREEAAGADACDPSGVGSAVGVGGGSGALGDADVGMAGEDSSPSGPPFAETGDPGNEPGEELPGDDISSWRYRRTVASPHDDPDAREYYLLQLKVDRGLGDEGSCFDVMIEGVSITGRPHVWLRGLRRGPGDRLRVPRVGVDGGGAGHGTAPAADGAASLSTAFYPDAHLPWVAFPRQLYGQSLRIVTYLADRQVSRLAAPPPSCDDVCLQICLPLRQRISWPLSWSTCPSFIRRQLFATPSPDEFYSLSCRLSLS